MDIDTIRFSHILEADTLERMDYFLSHTAFIISHKSESLETLQGVLWYLPTSSPIIIVSNCPPENLETLQHSLKEHMTSHRKLYLVHQKDPLVAHLLRECGVAQILDDDGRVRDGKVTATVRPVVLSSTAPFCMTSVESWYSGWAPIW